MGHIQHVCRSGKGQKATSRGGTKEENRKLHSFEIADELADDSLIGSLEVNNFNNFKQAVCDVIWVTPKVNGQTLKMELDTGSAVSTLPVQRYEEMLPNIHLVTTAAILKTFDKAHSVCHETEYGATTRAP